MERTTLYTWGNNGHGQLGVGDFSSRILPQPVAYFQRARLVHLVCGSRSTHVLDHEGRVFSWGKGDDGTLGIGERGTVMKPRLVEGLLGKRIATMACRGGHVLALTERGQLWAWGRNDDGQCGVPGSLPSHTAVPQRVQGLMGRRVTLISCGRVHSVAVEENGNLHSWGSGDDGVLGHGDTVSRAVPTLCARLAGNHVAAVACGSRHTLALTRCGTLYSWGWGVYGQLGHGDAQSRLEPTAVALGEEGAVIVQLACGYRHSMALLAEQGDGDARTTWAWGWGRHGQLGLGEWQDEMRPQPLEGFSESPVETLCLGGRHSLAITRDGRVYTWGRDEDGQLGLAAQGAKCTPQLIEAFSFDRMLPGITAACGWAHTAVIIRAAGKMIPSSQSASKLRAPRHFVMGDFEGLFGQLLGTAIQFILVERVLTSTCGFTHDTIQTQVLPGAAMVYLMGHAFFALQASNLISKTSQPVTALPQGINIVTFFAFTQLIMAPEYQSQIRQGASQVAAARSAYDFGLAASVLLGALELLGVPFVDTLRSLIPRAAMLSAIAGVSLTFIAMGFAMQIFAAPGTALVSMLLMLLFYAGNVKLPFKVPGGVLAVSAGAAIAASSHWLGYQWFHPPELTGGGTLKLPLLQYDFWRTFLRPEFWGCVSVVIPMWLVNLVNNLANIEAAAAVGDVYQPKSALLGLALIDLASACLGNPFPSCVYIGHSAFKAMGCRVGYLYLNMIPTAFFGMFQGAHMLQALFPIESGVGFLLWVGLQITAQGFEGDQTPEGWRHGPAVALGLIPSISAWSWQSISATFAATRSMFCDGLDEQLRSVTLGCNLELSEMIQRPSMPMEESGPIRDFQNNLSNLYLSGMFALANGYLLTSIIFSSMLVHIIDGRFNAAALCLLSAALISITGIIHSPTLDVEKSNKLFPTMYSIGALVLFACHQMQNRSEQLRELQVRWLEKMQLWTRDTASPKPLRRASESIMGLLRRISVDRSFHDDSVPGYADADYLRWEPADSGEGETPREDHLAGGGRSASSSCASEVILRRGSP